MASYQIPKGRDSLLSQSPIPGMDGKVVDLFCEFIFYFIDDPPVTVLLQNYLSTIYDGFL